MYDVIVIGGGAAGMSAAICAARNGAKTIIIDKNNKPGKKLYATGNGKCNLTNEDICYETHYNSSCPDYADFLIKSIGKLPNKQVVEFMSSIGIVTYSKNGYVYPSSNQASAVVWALLDELGRLGVRIIKNTTVTDIIQTDSVINVVTDSDIYSAGRVIISCGGKSYESLGGTDTGYDLARNIGTDIVEVKTALCPLIVDDDFTEIDGVRVNCVADLYINDVHKESERGELQLTAYGISGVMIFNLSSKAVAALYDNKKVSICFDFAPYIDAGIIAGKFITSSKRTALGVINGFVNDKLAKFILGKCNIDAKKKAEELTAADIDAVISCIKEYKADITGSRGYDQSQVCQGGVALTEVDDNFALRSNSRIFVTGEMLDIDGKCGGYNLTFAILSGIKAGNSAYAKTQSDKDKI